MESVLKKVGMLRQQESTNLADTPKSGQRRIAVFDHHEVHPDWKCRTDDPAMQIPVAPIRHHQSMRSHGKGRQDGVGKVDSDHTPLDRSKSVSLKSGKRPLEKAKEKTVAQYGKGTADRFIMSEVNQMRTERLAKALKALQTPPARTSDLINRTQSMRTPGRRHGAMEVRTTPIFGPVSKGGSSPRPICPKREFRRRTSSVPAWSDQFASFTEISSLIPDQHESPVLERMRTFTIDPAKGALVNRGDSFRHRCNTGAGTPATDRSANSSAFSSRSHSPMPPQAMTISSAEQASSIGYSQAGPVKHYHILVLGLYGVGKTSIVNQFMTSDYCNPFQNEIGVASGTVENSVTVILDGEESHLTFIEVDNQKNDLSLTLCGDGYIVVYSVDDFLSFENANQVLFQLRLQMYSADKPIILVGNKVDLARKRLVSSEEGKSSAKENRCKFVEIAVVLGHHLDELLVGILAQIRKNEKEESELSTAMSNEDLSCQHGPTAVHHYSPHSSPHSSPHTSALKRWSTKRRKGKGFGSVIGRTNQTATSCSNLTCISQKLADKVFSRRRASKSVEDLFSVKK